MRFLQETMTIKLWMKLLKFQDRIAPKHFMIYFKCTVLTTAEIEWKQELKEYS